MKNPSILYIVSYYRLIIILLCGFPFHTRLRSIFHPAAGVRDAVTVRRSGTIFNTKLVSFDRIGFPSWLHFSIPAWPRVVLVSRQHHHHQSRRRPRPAHAARLEPLIHFAVPPRSDPTLAVVVALLSSAGKGGAQGHPLLRWLAPLPSFCSFRRCAGLDLRARGLFACCPAVPSVCPVLSLTLFRGRALFRFRRTLLLLLLG